MVNIKKEITLAKNALTEMHFYDNVLCKDLICEIYCLASHFDYTTFIQIYANEETYFLHYARTYTADFWGIVSNSESFEGVQEAETHNGKVAKIICGMKAIPKDNTTIRNILSVIPNVTEFESDKHYVLDEYFTYIKYHLEDMELTFSDAKNIKNTVYSEEQIRILNNIYKLITSI